MSVENAVSFANAEYMFLRAREITKAGKDPTKNSFRGMIQDEHFAIDYEIQVNPFVRIITGQGGLIRISYENGDYVVARCITPSSYSGAKADFLNEIYKILMDYPI